MKLMLIAIIGLLAATGIACTVAQRVLPHPSEMTEEVELRETFEAGRVVAVTQCDQCHRQFYPNEFSPRAWPRIVDDMWLRSGISREDAADLEAYMVNASEWYRGITAASARAE